MYQSRTQAINALLARKRELEKVSLEVFGQKIIPTFGLEFEFYAVSNSSNPKEYPINDKILKTEFKGSSHVVDFHDLESSESSYPDVDGITKGGKYAEQLEIILSHKTLDGKNRILSPVEAAKTLEDVEKYIQSKVPEYGLNRIELPSKPTNRKLCNAAHIHVGTLYENGHNPFDDGKGKASKFLLSFIEASLNFARDGGFLFYAPSDNSFDRFGTVAGPQDISLKSKKLPDNMGAGLIRGEKYNVNRPKKFWGTPFNPKIQGKIHYEDRLASNEAFFGETPNVLGENNAHEFPYLFVEIHLIMLIEAIELYQSKMKDGTIEELTEESLKEFSAPLPKNLDEAIEQFKSSDLIKKYFSEEQISSHIDKIRNINSYEIEQRQMSL